MKKQLLISFLVGTSLVVSTSSIFAKTESFTKAERTEKAEKTERAESDKVMLTPRAKQAIERRCAVSETRVTNIVGKYDVAYPVHVRNYQKISQKVKEVITKAQAQGKDTTKLEAVVKTLDEKITTLDQQVKAVIAQLKVAQQYACGESHGKYVEEIKKARELAQTAHKTMLDVRSYYQNTVRPEIQALRTTKTK